MVSLESVEKQLKHIGFNIHAWGKTEAKELTNILVEGEEIFECVNGIYDGGFALLVATDVRVLLVDKKPLNYLTVEDLRFDMINEIDYSHRLIGAHITISTGSKTLRFTSYNQPRLRSLITRVQHSMAETKKKQSENQVDQNQHLGQINQQLQAYLVAQYQQQEQMRQQLEKVKNEGSQAEAAPVVPAPIKPSPELADYLLAQSLLLQHQQQSGQNAPIVPPTAIVQPSTAPITAGDPSNPRLADLYSEGMQEVFGKRQQQVQATPQVAAVATAPVAATQATPLEVNALRIAYSKLPMALRNRKFGRPSFHAHSQQQAKPQPVAS